MSVVSSGTPYTLVAVVTPITDDPATSGKIKHVPCAPQVKHKWLMAYPGEGGRLEYGIEPLYGRRGYVLLRDLFETEGNLDGWAEYERHLVECAAGKARKPFPVEKLPAEVRRRRACGGDPDPVVKPGKAGARA